MVTMEIKDLSAGYGNKTIIRDINFSVRSGDILTLLGANGQGKTTLLKTMAGFMKPFNGTVTIEGKNIRKMDKKTLAGYLSYVPQNHVTGIAFTVRDMVVLGRIARCNFYASPARKDYEEAESSLEKLGLLHLADKNYQELSGGEQRLVLIARALTQHTKLMLLDEPVSNLDMGNQIKVLKILSELSEKGIGIIVSSHFPEHSLWLNTMTGILRKGTLSDYDLAEKIITGDTLSDLYGTPISVINNNGSRYCEPLFVKEIQHKKTFKDRRGIG